MEFDKSLTDIDKNIDYNQIYWDIIRGTYKCIGMGTGRLVFDLKNGYIVKVATSLFGIVQNEAEYKIALADDTGLFAKIPSASKRFRMLLMEKADKIKDISYVWNYFNVRNNKEFYKVKEIQDICSRFSLVKRDLGRAANWGQINGRPIIIDFGYTYNRKKILLK